MQDRRMTMKGLIFLCILLYLYNILAVFQNKLYVFVV